MKVDQFITLVHELKKKKAGTKQHIYSIISLWLKTAYIYRCIFLKMQKISSVIGGYL